MLVTRYFRFPNKRIRAQVIADYMRANGYSRAVCFSCGNASRELALAGVDVLDISPTGDLQALRWFTIAEVAAAFPGRFDATSGHLPFDLMGALADAYRGHIGQLPDSVALPTGSGETLVALKMAFPQSSIQAVYNLDAATRYEEGAPLNRLVRALASKVVFADGAR